MKRGKVSECGHNCKRANGPDGQFPCQVSTLRYCALYTTASRLYGSIWQMNGDTGDNRPHLHDERSVCCEYQAFKILLHFYAAAPEGGAYFSGREGVAVVARVAARA